MEMKRLLGVDFGERRTGLAMCDESGFLAYGAGCVQCEGIKKIASRVATFAREKKIDKIIVGNPINMDETEGDRSRRAKKFASLLREAGFDTELLDERLTTVSAHELLSESDVSAKKRKQKIDELSATLILQTYLDSLK